MGFHSAAGAVIREHEGTQCWENNEWSVTEWIGFSKI